MWCLYWFAVGLVIGGGIGIWSHWRWGGAVRAAVDAAGRELGRR